MTCFRTNSITVVIMNITQNMGVIKTTLPNEDKTEYTTRLLKSVGYKIVEQETGGYRFLTHKNRYSI